MIKLDYTISTSTDRIEKVKEILAQRDTPPSASMLETLADYIVFTKDKEDKKKILTDNRMVTVNKRETSYEGLVTKFENGEDGVYNLITENKNIILTPKISITPEDIAEIPDLALLKAEIEKVEERFKKAEGRDKYLLKKQLIEMHQDQYVIKTAYKPPVRASKLVKSFTSLDLAETVTIDENGEPHSTCLVDFFNPDHVSALLCNYSAVKEEVSGSFWCDAYYMMLDFDNLVEAALKDLPLLYNLMIYKIDGKQNIEIQQLLYDEFDIKYTVEYISSLWRNKIPKIIANKAKEDYIIWYYTHKEKGDWKKCSKCGQKKLRTNRFFSKNSASSDGFYSICKECRNKKTKQKKGDE